MQSLVVLVVLVSTLVAAALARATPAAMCVAETADDVKETWPISGYIAVTPPVSGTGYDIDAAWQSAHGFNSTMDISMTHKSNMTDYAEFKCQFSCNSDVGCVAFFGRYVNVDTEQEMFECMSFKALLDNSSFTTTTSNMANGGYNKLCS